LLRALIFSFAVLLPSVPAALESGVSAADMSEIRGVIHRQIDAFRRDDAHGAFALVSPGVQQAFGTPERFLDTVRMAYRAVYRPSAVSFLDLVVMGGDVVQPVQVTDRTGAVWVAYYAMQRQRDGSWRTNGCHLVQPSRSISA
jgi:hypothetical protein